MKLRELRWIGLAIGMTMVFAAAALADGSRPGQGVLSEMGLGGLTVMSDEEAMAVRGHGFKHGSSVAVFGNSFATINTPFGTAHSENGYAAEGKHFAFGKNGSEAGIQIKTSGGHKGGGKKARPKSSRWGGKAGKGGRPGGGGNHGGGHHGGNSKVTTVKVFAGGFSIAGAH